MKPTHNIPNGNNINENTVKSDEALAAITGSFPDSTNSNLSMNKDLLSDKIPTSGDIFAEIKRKEWAPRLEKKTHFELHYGISPTTYWLLFFRGEVFVSVDDIARALTGSVGGEFEFERKTKEILETLRDWPPIEVPGQEIPGDFGGASPGRYLPLEVTLRFIPWGSDLPYDALKLLDFLEEFEERKAGGSAD